MYAAYTDLQSMSDKKSSLRDKSSISTLEMLIASHNLVSCVTFIFQTRPNLPDGLILDLFIVSGMEFFLNISG